MTATVYSRDVADTILARLAEGESLRGICRSEGMPAASTVRGWALDDRDGFAARFTRANLIGVAGLKDEILEISDDGSNDTYRDDQGNVRTDVDVVQRSKLRVESRRWLLAKLLPREYGDRVELNHTGTVAVAVALAEARRRGALLDGEPEPATLALPAPGETP